MFTRLLLLIFAMGSSMVAASPFVIEKEVVEEMTAKTGLTVHQLLHQLVFKAKGLARPSISHYHVGIAALGKSGNIYLGVNLEFQGCPLNETVHGEQFLVTNARNHGEQELVAIALSAAPCGHCRQFFNEMGSEQILILTPEAPERTLASILPESFGPKDLGLVPMLMHGSAKRSAASLAECAFQAALSSYAPYSEAKSGVAIQTKDGSIYTGSYLENAAFNPSLGPLHTALVALVVGGKEYEEIAHVILSEQEGDKVSHEFVVRGILRQIAPDAIFEVIEKSF